MKMKLLLGILLLGFAVVLPWGCTPEFEVYAPEKSIRAIYSVLNPNDSVQFVRISRVFQVRDDAERFAAENDLSIRGLNVRLTDLGNGQMLQAVEVDTIRKDSNGIFHTYQTVYKFRTDGSSNQYPKLLADHQYRLEVGIPESEEYNSAVTTIPTAPGFRSGLGILVGAGNTRCLPKLNLLEKLPISWEKSTGYAYELSILFRYTRNGVADSALWGPSNLIESNVRCNDGSNRICYEFQDEQLLVFLKSHLVPDGTQYAYDRHDSCLVNPTNDPAINDMLPKSIEFKVVTVDEFLYKYMLANDPRYTDLTGAKPEYTNFTGNMEAVGVLGSINQDKRWAILNTCSEYHLGLNGVTTPPPSCPL